MLAHCGRYQILGEVGSGSMGVVYRALDPKIDRLVAVKVLRQEQSATEASTKRFLKEARAIGRLSHPNIVTVHDMGEEQGNVYFTMELIDGRSLSEILRERRLTIAEAVGIGIQIAAALGYAHQRGVIHQDVKPGNIIISHDGRIKITDFGIARLQDVSATDLTKAGEIMGTPAYMSPEQIEGKAVDGRSDIFSLGVLLYEMVTGGKPFKRTEGTTLAGLLNSILNVNPPAPMAASPEVPKRLSDVIEKTLKKDPQQRFQTGSKLAAALKECLVKPAAPIAVRRATIAKPDLHNVLIPAVALAVMAIGGIGYFSFRVNENVIVSPPLSRGAFSNRAGSPSGPMDGRTGEPQTPEPESQPDAYPPRTAQPVPESPKSTRADTQTRPTELPTTPRQVQSRGRRAPLTVVTTPQGARVYVDNKLISDITPLTVMLSLGQHHIKTTLAGYQDMESDINVKDTMEYPLGFALKPVGASSR